MSYDSGLNPIALEKYKKELLKRFEKEIPEMEDICVRCNKPYGDHRGHFICPEMTAIEKFQKMASTDEPFGLFKPKLRIKMNFEEYWNKKETLSNDDGVQPILIAAFKEVAERAFNAAMENNNESEMTDLEKLKKCYTEIGIFFKEYVNEGYTYIITKSEYDLQPVTNLALEKFIEFDEAGKLASY